MATDRVTFVFPGAGHIFPFLEPLFYLRFYTACRLSSASSKLLFFSVGFCSFLFVLCIPIHCRLCESALNTIFQRAISL